MLFFVFWIIIFSFLQRIIGREVDKGDSRYRHVSEAARYFLHTWIYSTGGGATAGVDYEKWYDFGKKGSDAEENPFFETN